MATTCILFNLDILWGEVSTGGIFRVGTCLQGRLSMGRTVRGGFFRGGNVRGGSVCNISLYNTHTFGTYDRFYLSKNINTNTETLILFGRNGYSRQLKVYNIHPPSLMQTSVMTINTKRFILGMEYSTILAR